MHVRTGGFFSSKPGNADRIFRYDFGCFGIYLGNLSVKCHNYCRLKAKQPRISRTDMARPPGRSWHWERRHRQNSHQELFVRGVRGAERHVTEIDDAVKAVFLGHGRNAWCKVMQRGRSLDSFEMHVSC